MTSEDYAIFAGVEGLEHCAGQIRWTGDDMRTKTSLIQAPSRVHSYIAHPAWPASQ